MLVYIAVGWGLGIAAGAWVRQPVWAWLVLGALAALTLYLQRRDPRLRPVLVCALAASLGAARYQLAQPDLADAAFIAHYNAAEAAPNEVTLEGVVGDDPDARGSRTNLRVRVDTLLLPDAAQAIPVRGTVLVYAPRFSDERRLQTGAPEWRYGDRLRVFGALEAPPAFADFSYADYLARQGVYSQVRVARVIFVAAGQGSLAWQTLFDFKRRALQVLAQIFPEPHAALLQGILLGVESGIPPALKDAFSATGTSHIVAISGLMKKQPRRRNR
jgi:competence protein ComEC